MANSLGLSTSTPHPTPPTSEGAVADKRDAQGREHGRAGHKERDGERDKGDVGPGEGREGWWLEQGGVTNKVRAGEFTEHTTSTNAE